MNNQIIPLSDKVLILPLSKETVKLESGLEVDESDLEKGEVVSVSHNLQNYVKEGDVAYYPKGKQTGQNVNGKSLIWLKAEDIWGIIRK